MSVTWRRTHIRGRVIGNVMTGLMIGILLARPAASFIASVSSWHVAYAPVGRHHGLAGAGAALYAAGSQAAGAPRLWCVAGLDGALGVDHAGAAAARALSIQPVRRVQSVLDHGAAGAWPVPISGCPRPALRCLRLPARAARPYPPVAGRIADRGWTRPATAAAHVVDRPRVSPRRYWPSPDRRSRWRSL